MNSQTLPIKARAVYGGTFDVPTMGHFQMIQKAARLFGHIDVVVAANSQKTPWFTTEERVDMLKEMVKGINVESGCVIEVVALPPTIYLATFALNRGASFLIRGIRDIWDFNYENNIYHTNRRIQPSIETMYLMPDQNYSMVSSSWVKSLVGCSNWTHILYGQVHDCVLRKVVEYYMKNRFYKLVAENYFARDRNATRMWNDIVARYKPFDDVSYHNLGHILKCLEVLDEHFSFLPTEEKAMIELALWFHDIYPSEDKSADCLSEHLGFCNREDLISKSKKLIEATKHNVCHYDTDAERIIASIDLFPLSGTMSEYGFYNHKVYLEYLLKSHLEIHEFQKEWRKGRSEFIQKMLAREVIYPWPQFEKQFGSQARENMSSELQELSKGGSIITGLDRIPI